MTEAPLYLHGLPVRLSALARQAGERGWAKVRRRGREGAVAFDEGRALHHVLGETFGPGALKPFRLMVAPRSDLGRIYAYSVEPAETLRETARDLSPPEMRSAVEWERLESREMPGEWRAERRLGFDIRIRPVRRVHSRLEDPFRRVTLGAGSEIDAFRHEALRNFPDDPPRRVDDEELPSGMMTSGRDRAAVYIDWLQEKLGDAATIVQETARLAKFRRVLAHRGDAATEGPDAVLHGDLIICDPGAFGELLRHGVGRHRSYGYGMMLVRPPNRRPPER